MSIIHAKQAYAYMALESAPGTAIADTSLFLAANLVGQVHDLSWEAKPTIEKRNPEGRSLQGIASVLGQKPASAKFKTRCFSSGTAETALPYANLLKSCYCSDTLVASTSETFAQSPAQASWYTLGLEYLTEDGTAAYRQVLKGVRGNATLKADKIGAPFIWEWDMQGAWNAAGGANTTPVSSLTFSDEVTNGIRFDQFQMPTGLLGRQCDSFELNFGNKVEMITDITDSSGLLYAVLAEQQPTLKLGFRSVLKATADDVSTFMLGALTSAGATWGTVAGKKMTFATNNSAQIASLAAKAIGAAHGFDVTLDLFRTVTGDASDAFSLVFA